MWVRTAHLTAGAQQWDEVALDPSAKPDVPWVAHSHLPSWLPGGGNEWTTLGGDWGGRVLVALTPMDRSQGAVGTQVI